MAIHGSQGILKVIRQPQPSNQYTVPRYRVTLVRDNRAVSSSSPLTDFDHRCRHPQTVLCGTRPRTIPGLWTRCEAQHHRGQCGVRRLPHALDRAAARGVQTAHPDERCRLDLCAQSPVRRSHPQPRRSRAHQPTPAGCRPPRHHLARPSHPHRRALLQLRRPGLARGLRLRPGGAKALIEVYA